MCAASSIRAMPETEIPPVLRGDIYSSFGIEKIKKHPKKEKNYKKFLKISSKMRKISFIVRFMTQCVWYN